MVSGNSHGRTEEIHETSVVGILCLNPNCLPPQVQIDPVSLQLVHTFLLPYCFVSFFNMSLFSTKYEFSKLFWTCGCVTTMLGTSC
jgi:hypothetical protein